MTFGVTTTGFVLKRLPDIKSDIEDKFRGSFGKSVNLDSRTPEGQLIAIVSETLADIWEKNEQLYYAAYPATAEGVPLDGAVALTGTTRKTATKSTVTVTIFGDVGIVVPITFVAQVENNSSARFKIDAPATIEAGVDEVQSLTYSAVPDEGIFVLQYNGNNTTNLDFDATISEIETALEALVGIEDVSVTGDFTIGHTITFINASGKQVQPLLVVASNTMKASAVAVTVTVTEVTAGKAPQVDATFTAIEAGATQAPSGSLTVIENPLSGVTSITNALDATVGDDVEIDLSLKIRQKQEVAQAGKGTVDAIQASLSALAGVTSATVFDNREDVTDGFGRPPHSVDCVVEGGDNAVIAQNIFDTTGAGIDFFGDISENAVDSKGFIQVVKFSRPTPINIYFEADLTTNADFPADGLTQVQDAILAYGDTLQLGDDVIVYTPLVSAIGTVAGIIDLVIRIGTAASPTLDDNIVIGDRERAKFDSSRITLVEV